MKEVMSKSAGNKARIVKQDVVTCEHTTYHKATGKYFNLTTSFDFRDVNHEKILKLAAETLLIRWRTAFKDADKIDDSADNQMVEVANLKFGKIRFTKSQRALKAFDDLSPEEKKAMLDLLTAGVS